MKHVLKVTLLDQTVKLVNEDQICTVESGGRQGKVEIARVKMANGDVLDVIQPPYDQWEADTYFANG